MNEDVVDAAFTEAGTAVAVRVEPQQTALTFFTAVRPADRLAFATEVADALKPVLVQKKLTHHLNKKNPEDEYVELEGWQTCGFLCGVSAKVVSSSPLPDGTGFEATAVVVRMDTGVVIGGGDGMCSRAEWKWKDRDDYALRGMAQTRAQSRALRGILAFILVLAGYKPTPSDEMPPIDAPPEDKPKSKPAQTKAQELCARWTALGDGRDEAAFRATFAGKTVSEIRAAVQAAETDVAAGAIRRPASPIPDTATPSGTEAVREREPAAASGGDRALRLVPEPDSDGWEMTKAQRADLMRAHDACGHLVPSRSASDAMRHTWYTEHGLPASSKDWTPKEYERAMGLLFTEAQRSPR